MSKNKSILIVLTAIIFAVTSVWILFQPKETDVYFSALRPYASYAPVLTSRPTTCNVTAKSLPSIPSELVSDFLQANSTSAKSISLKALTEKFAVMDSSKQKNQQLIDISSNRKIFDPRMLVYLSRVGYNKNHSEALFCVKGLGIGLFHLRYQNDRWQQVQMITTGII